MGFKQNKMDFKQNTMDFKQNTTSFKQNTMGIKQTMMGFEQYVGLRDIKLPMHKTTMQCLDFFRSKLSLVSLGTS